MTPPAARRTKPALLYLDQDLLVIDKPPGLPAVPGRGQTTCLLDLIRARPEFAGDEPLRIVQRLDREASGVLLYARTLRAQRALTAQFAQRRVQKLYHALVCGHVAADGEISLMLWYDKRAGRMRAGPRRGKPALTRYRVLEHLPGNTLLECQPVTGRTHQLRVHLAAIGHPLSVDPLYGGGQALYLSRYKPDYHHSTRRPERPLIDRLTLHAAGLRCAHPADGRVMTFAAPLPRDMRAALTQLGRLAAARA